MNPLDLLRDDLETVDLAQPFEVGMPASPTHPAFEFALRQRHGDVVRVPRPRPARSGRAGRVADLLAAPEPRPGDVVLVRTGWAQLWDDPAAYLGGTDGVPGVAADAARWLAERGVAVVGADTIALEHIPAGGGLSSLPAHRILLAEAGINLIEVMALEDLSASLAARGTGEFPGRGAAEVRARGAGYEIRRWAGLRPVEDGAPA